MSCVGLPVKGFSHHIPTHAILILKVWDVTEIGTERRMLV